MLTVHTGLAPAGAAFPAHPPSPGTRGRAQPSRAPPRPGGEEDGSTVTLPPGHGLFGLAGTSARAPTCKGLSWELHRRTMEQSSPFAQRLKSISTRRKLHELILSTRLDLEQEKLRAQRLKRKSLREQWLMEGTSVSPDDPDPSSPLREAETHIEELQQRLTSLQMQMQQADKLETWKVLREPLSEEDLRDKTHQSKEGLEKVNMTASSSSEGRSRAQSTLASAPAETKENLQNGGMQDGDLFGDGGGPEGAKAESIAVPKEKGDHRKPQGSSEAASPANPAGQSVDPSQAPASHPRKWAMEKMVIRDHLGQEVGCMDTVGQGLSPLEKEKEDHANLEDRWDRWSQAGPGDVVLDQRGALGDGPLDNQLGSFEGPVGLLSAHQDPPSPSSLLQRKNSSPKEQEGGPLEMGSPATEAGGMEVGQEEVPEGGAQEIPAVALATGDALGTGHQEHPTQVPVEGRGRAESPHRSPVQTQPPGEEVPLPPPEAGKSALEPSSWHTTKETSRQGEELARQEAGGAPPDTSPSPVLDHVVPLQGAAISALEETPAAPDGPKPKSPGAQVPSRPDSDVFLPDPTPPSADDPGGSPMALHVLIPPVLQDTEKFFPAGEENPTPSLQEADGALPDETQTLLPGQASPNLPNEEGSHLDQGLLSSKEPPTPSFQEAPKPLMEGRSASDLPEEKSPLAGPAPACDKAQSPTLQDASLCSSAPPSSGQETLQPLLDTTEAEGIGDAEEGRGPSLGSAGAGETSETLENRSSERQPLLKGTTASGAPLGLSARDPPLQAGVLKSPAATGQQVLSDSNRTSANPASSPPQVDLPLPGEDQDPEHSRRKPKSCQCCTLM
ncbi:paralemmin-3 [Paroedura picta]|uniref:paralemmin-3 n=1 Tax=Paroedura picta TaxID=143630 RepID=UPI00405731F8